MFVFYYGCFVKELFQMFFFPYDVDDDHDDIECT